MCGNTRRNSSNIRDPEVRSGNMPKLTLDDLKKLRETKRAELARRDGEKTVEVIVGMGTCGIAAGSKQTFDAFVEELDSAGLTNVAVKQTGCLGQCSVEPMAEVKVPGMPDVIYGKVDAEIAKKIVRCHIIDKRMVQDHLFDKPAGDITAGR